MAEVNFTLAAGQGGGQISKEDAAKQQAQNAAIRKSFDDGVALTNEGKNEEAIAKFNEVIAAAPKCAECYANIATVYGRMKDYEKAEAAFKQAIEVKPDFAEAYNGLSTVYNAEKKFDLAAEASAQAMKLSGAGGAAGAAAAPPPLQRSTRESSSGTPARFRRPRHSSNRPSSSIRIWPRRTIGWAWRS